MTMQGQRKRIFLKEQGSSSKEPGAPIPGEELEIGPKGALI
jgi:hypothetical protein